MNTTPFFFLFFSQVFNVGFMFFFGHDDKWDMTTESSGSIESRNIYNIFSHLGIIDLIYIEHTHIQTPY